MIGIENYIKIYEIFALEYTVTQFLWKKLKCWRYRKYIFPFDLFFCIQEKTEMKQCQKCYVLQKVHHILCISSIWICYTKYVCEGKHIKRFRFSFHLFTWKCLSSDYLLSSLLCLQSWWFLSTYRSALHLTRSPANMLDAFLACGQTL